MNADAKISTIRLIRRLKSERGSPIVLVVPVVFNKKNADANQKIQTIQLLNKKVVHRCSCCLQKTERVNPNQYNWRNL